MVLHSCIKKRLVPLISPSSSCIVDSFQWSISSALNTLEWKINLVLGPRGTLLFTLGEGKIVESTTFDQNTRKRRLGTLDGSYVGCVIFNLNDMSQNFLKPFFSLNILGFPFQNPEISDFFVFFKLFSFSLLRIRI